MKVLSFAGSPKEMGQAFGESCRSDIAALYTKRVQNAVEQAKLYGSRTIDEEKVLQTARLSLPIVKAYHPEGYEELCGIAEGAKMSIEMIWAMNALTDLRDVLSFGETEGEGCSSFLLQKDFTQTGKGLAGQTWDLKTDNMPYVLIVQRNPENGPKTACLTLVGCLSLIGMNEHGLSIGTTNIRSSDSRPGVGYLDIIHKTLSAKTFEEGAECITKATRSGAHYYYLVDSTGNAAAFECTAKQYARIDVPSKYYVHCNHMLDTNNQLIQCETPFASSHHRQSRLGQLIEQKGKTLTREDMQKFLADHDGEPNSICRHDFQGISSNGSILMEPETRRIWAIHGPACQGSWIELSPPWKMN